MITPQLNLNGSSVDDLTIPRLKAVDHLCDAMEVLMEVIPHSRDYIGNPMAYAADREEHYDRIRRLSTIREEIFAEAVAIRKRGAK